MTYSNNCKRFFLMALLVCTVAPSAHAFTRIELPSKMNTAVLVAAASYFGVLQNRTSVPDFKKEGTFTGVLNAKQLVMSPSAYFRNLRNLYTDHFVGQRGNEKCQAAGVLGTMDSYLPPYESTKRFLAFAAAMYAIQNASAVKNAFNLNVRVWSLDRRADGLAGEIAHVRRTTASKSDLESRDAAIHGLSQRLFVAEQNLKPLTERAANEFFNRAPETSVAKPDAVGTAASSVTQAAEPSAATTGSKKHRSSRPKDVTPAGATAKGLKPVVE